MAASIAMVAAIPTATAEFRYVPPDRPPTAAVEPVPDVAAPPPGEPAHAGWQVHAGETLRETLDRWGARAGIDVLFLTDRRYRLGEARTFEGGFGEAAKALFAALAHLPRPPVGELSGDGRRLTVLHRVRSLGEAR